MRALMIASLFLFACERDPSIVVRFDTIDAGQRRVDAAVPRDAASTVDAAVKTKPDGAKEDKKTAQCRTEYDCALVPDGCCDCANGGKLVAMTKNAAVAAQRARSCKDAMCTMMVSTDPTCGKRAACVEGVCGMREARPDETRDSRIKLPAR